MRLNKKFISKLTAIALTGTICTGMFAPTLAYSNEVKSTSIAISYLSQDNSFINLDLTKAELAQINKVIADMKIDFNSSQSVSTYGVVGKINKALKIIIKYVNFLPDKVKNGVLKFLGPIQNLVDTVQITSISSLKHLLINTGMWPWLVEAICDIVSFIIF